jgi:site-specific DNA-cytosine methylase
MAGKMKVLVACEESQVVCKAFRKLGHDAYSCDIIDCSGGHPEWHIKDNVLNVIRDSWDMMIAHPPCTHLAVSGARWFKEKRNEQDESIEFFMTLILTDIPRIAIENPISIMSTRYRKPDQIIQPWQYGHGETKATCLWLKNLPKLNPTKLVNGREPRIHKMAPSKTRSRDRAVTYQGIADAMAMQWGGIVE